MSAARVMAIWLAGIAAAPAGAQPIAAAAIPPAAAPVTPRAPARPSARDYRGACATCHDNGGYAVRVLADRAGAGKALLDKSDDLDPALIRAAVRGGIGAMPAMSRLEVSDVELAGIIAQLTTQRRSKR